MRGRLTAIEEPAPSWWARGRTTETKDDMYDYYAHEHFKYRHHEAEQEAAYARMVTIAVQARRRNRVAARESRELQLATEAIGRAGERAAR